jgi:hypothetical protein
MGRWRKYSKDDPVKQWWESADLGLFLKGFGAL